MRKLLLHGSLFIALLSFAISGFAQNLNCSTISTFPYIENFDGSTWTSGTGFGNTGDAIDTCWTRNPVSPSFGEPERVLQEVLIQGLLALITVQIMFLPKDLTQHWHQPI